MLQCVDRVISRNIMIGPSPPASRRMAPSRRRPRGTPARSPRSESNASKEIARVLVRESLTKILHWSESNACRSGQTTNGSGIRDPRFQSLRLDLVRAGGMLGQQIAHQKSTPQKSSWTSGGVVRWISSGCFPDLPVLGDTTCLTLLVKCGLVCCMRVSSCRGSPSLLQYSPLSKKPALDK